MPVEPVTSFFDDAVWTSLILNSKLTLRSLIRINGTGTILKIGTVRVVSTSMKDPGLAGSGTGCLYVKSAVLTLKFPESGGSSCKPTMVINSTVDFAASACASIAAFNG